MCSEFDKLKLEVVPALEEQIQDLSKQLEAKAQHELAYIAAEKEAQEVSKKLRTELDDQTASAKAREKKATNNIKVSSVHLLTSNISSYLPNSPLKLLTTSAAVTSEVQVELSVCE